MRVTIAIDAMSGDHGRKITVPAALRALDAHANLRIILVGQKQVLAKRLKSALRKYGERLLFHHAEEVVEMGEQPSKALRYKKQSSMRLAINLVKEHRADACVSAGNTGALMATARFVLKTLPGVSRPAIVALIPTVDPKRFVRMLDLGANVDCSPEQLQQFGIMGSILCQATDNIPNPRVALLNVGVEEMKGNEQVKRAAELLSQTRGIHYTGFVEGNDIFNHAADVIVSDGFVGNVALKVMEGEAKLFYQAASKSLTHSVMSKVGVLFLLPVIRDLKKRLNPARYNGASLLGLKGIVIKSHGNTSIRGFFNAIERAIAEVEHNVPKLISDRVQQLLDQ
jgi:phosphate acyltransferase